MTVRGSTTAEDLPETSFAGQQESFLNVGKSGRWYAPLYPNRKKPRPLKSGVVRRAKKVCAHHMGGQPLEVHVPPLHVVQLE